MTSDWETTLVTSPALLKTARRWTMGALGCSPTCTPLPHSSSRTVGQGMSTQKPRFKAHSAPHCGNGDDFS